MNTKLNEYKSWIKTKKVAVLGIGISNTPLIKYLAKLGVDITAFDKADEDQLKETLNNLAGLNVKYVLGKDYLSKLNGFDVIFKTPKVRFDIPELVKERERGAVVTSEMEVFVELCPAEIFAVTGSDGKTTTTTLIYNILKEEGYRCWLGGNIGTPLLDKIDEIKESDKVVLELSSFQLHTMQKSPNIAVVTNMAPNHLDVHKSMEEYIDAKKNIFRYQGQNDKVVLNYDNSITKGFAEEAKGKVVYFSRCGQTDSGAVLENGRLVYKSSGKTLEIVNADDIVIPGEHNVENYLAAIAAVIEHVKPETIKRVATTFKGVEHRIELAREVRGIKFYNDSIGTSPSRTMAGLKSFRQKVILIAGGYDKNIPYDDMGEIMAERVKCLVLTGATGPKIRDALLKEIERSGRGKDIPVFMCKSLEEAVQTAYENAVSGDVVLFSPASASFDMFRNFEERGNKFKEIVNNLQE
ncbi:MAG TPA: UDP-N-acetylmuramoyl-L-alanine--D-glutamate ligase [Clostridiaceae bacterium]|nr:UDP-N-acetylmuramoyl-L-alanine--D-glutamate ligase [Clostridiaceae bacterium]